MRMAVEVVVLVVSGIAIVAGILPQASGAPSGKLIQVEGQVSVNGTSAISGATVFSDSTVTTAGGSSAVVSLGKLGRVEVLPSSTMVLTFGNATVNARMLDSGRGRLSSSSGVNATTSTKDGQLTTTGNQRNEYMVDTCLLLIALGHS